MKKGRSRVEIASPIHLIILQIEDGKRLLFIDQEGQTQVANSGLELLKIVKDFFGIDAQIS